MLGGHLDDMEVDWSKPIVSIRSVSMYIALLSFSFMYFGCYIDTYFLFGSSLGCKAIFLLGGKSRNDEPLAMFLRSGDIVLMSGEARERFHGQYINYLCSLVCC